ncbi:unnamed protein product, partial [Rotaria sp. Silwood2]
MLSQYIRFDQDNDTKDAEALESAVDLLINNATRGEKRIFIITDGYSNSGSLLSLVQQRAENASIDIIAMAIGDDRTNLHGNYKRYIRCTTSYGLPKALKALFDNEPSNESIDRPMESKKWTALPTDRDKDAYLKDIKTNPTFKDIIQKLKGEREKILVNSGEPPSNMSCDICFCIDCTGSMSRWLSATKVQMKIIISEIKKKIVEKFPSLKLKLSFAIVAFRDINDMKPFETLDFTDDDRKVINFLNQLTAYGGNDLPEDVLGALDQCLNLKNWSKSNARFIILITDAPGHGGDLNGDPSDRYPDGTKHTVTTICDDILKKDSEIELMFCCINPAATLKMQEAFEQEFNKRKNQTGKEFKTIKLFGDNPIDSRLFHFVFVLDESGSMSWEDRWVNLVSAYNSFLDRRNNDQGGNDIFSVIQFDDSAQIICKKTPLSNVPKTLSMKGGGTNYLSGLVLADLVIASDTTNSTIVMIFMSDGDDGGPNPLSYMNSLRDNRIQPGSKGDDLLRKMAKAGGGDMHSALTGVQLVSVFDNLASDCSVTGTLVSEFAKILSEE